MDVFVTPVTFGGASGDAVIYSYCNAGVFSDYNFLFLDMSHTATAASRKASVVASIASYALAHSYTVLATNGLELLGGGSAAHIADGATNNPTNAPTNLNIVTTLLGALTTEVNATNTKQNQIATNLNDLATKFNAVLAALQAQSILLP